LYHCQTKSPAIARVGRPYRLYRTAIQGGPKNRTCLNVDNSAMVSGRKTCYTSKFLEGCKE